jgi:hypothetical protein
VREATVAAPASEYSSQCSSEWLRLKASWPTGANPIAGRDELADEAADVVFVWQRPVDHRPDFRVIGAQPDTWGARGASRHVDGFAADGVVPQARRDSVVQE